MNSNAKNKADKDFIDKFIEYFEPYQKSGVRSIAVAVCFIVSFVIGTIASPSIIRGYQHALPFSIEFIQLSPFELIYNYLKIGFFFSLFTTLPVFVYQFGKLKIDKSDVNKKTNLLLAACVLAVILILNIFLTYKILFPIEIMLLYGINFDVAEFSTSLSSIVSTAIFTYLILFLIILLPILRILIKKSLFFNYATLNLYKKPIIIYIAVLSAILSLPLEIISVGFVFLVFYLVYKLLIIFAMKKD